MRKLIALAGILSYFASCTFAQQDSKKGPPTKKSETAPPVVPTRVSDNPPGPDAGREAMIFPSKVWGVVVDGKALEGAWAGTAITSWNSAIFQSKVIGTAPESEIRFRSGIAVHVKISALKPGSAESPTSPTNSTIELIDFQPQKNASTVPVPNLVEDRLGEKQHTYLFVDTKNGDVWVVPGMRSTDNLRALPCSGSRILTLQDLKEADPTKVTFCLAGYSDAAK